MAREAHLQYVCHVTVVMPDGGVAAATERHCLLDKSGANDAAAFADPKLPAQSWTPQHFKVPALHLHFSTPLLSGPLKPFAFLHVDCSLLDCRSLFGTFPFT